MELVLVGNLTFRPRANLLAAIARLFFLLIAELSIFSDHAFATDPPPIPIRPESAKLQAEATAKPRPGPVTKPQSASPKPKPAIVNPPPLPVPPAPAEPEAKRVRVADASGRVVVARLHGGPDTKVVLLPDGQLGWPESLVFTEAPFKADSIETIRDSLLAGPYKGFQVIQDEHYLVFTQGSTAFARASAHLLESLYRGLAQELLKSKLSVHQPEFPLVAVIFRTEDEFRAHKKVEPEVRAYYEILSNRIFFYEESAADQDAPEIASRRRPQTVAHEGTHQILQNIGIQPRLAEWPLWLVEGLAEYCAPPMVLKKADWAGVRRINPMHMATLHDLRDTQALQGGGGVGNGVTRVGRGVAAPNLVESLVTSTQLSPTDYALSWALTHYLAVKKSDDFVAFLKEMSEVAPLARLTPEDHLRIFRRHFGADLIRLGKAVDHYIDGLKGYEVLPYYAVVFEQPLPNGSVRRGTLVSQSPSLIRQWVEEMQTSQTGPVQWHTTPFPTRTRALIAAEQWLQGR